MANVPKGIETLPKISIARVRYMSVTDRRRTDIRHADGRAIAYSERERE